MTFPWISYVYKSIKNGLPPFRPFLSVIDTPAHKLAKVLVSILSDVTQNEFTLKDSFTFVDEILTRGSDFYMTGLDGDALFTNIRLDKIIEIFA